MRALSVCNMPYTAVTSAEKARARRLEKSGRVKIVRELDTRIVRVRGRHRLVTRESYYVEPINVATLNPANHKQLDGV